MHTTKKSNGVEPMRIGKDVAIMVLLLHPEDMHRIFPGWKGTVEELVSRLNDDPAEYLDELGPQAP